MQVLAQTHSPVAFTIHRILCLFFPLLVGIIQHTCKGYLLISSHNLPPSEANTRERGVCWGHPRPRQEASPPALLIYDWMSAKNALTVKHSGIIIDSGSNEMHHQADV